MNDIYSKSFLESFWEDSEYSKENYEGDSLSQDLINQVEKNIKYRLPQSYVNFMKFQNGGIPINNCLPTTTATSWAEDHVEISGFYSVGEKAKYSLLGTFGTQFWINEWGYPSIGIVICDCPSAGHDLIFLDYSVSGPMGEPQVVHVDQERNYQITILARNFETFVQSLVNESIYDTSEKDKSDAFGKVDHGVFSESLEEICQSYSDPNSAKLAIRTAARRIVERKGYFSLHADELSYDLYDILFFLYTERHGKVTKDKFLVEYPKLIVFNAEFRTGGYAPDFIKDWIHQRTDRRQIGGFFGKLQFSAKYQKEVILKIEELCLT